MERNYFTVTLCIELEVSKKQSEADKKKIEELTRERDLLSKVWPPAYWFLPARRYASAGITL